MNRLFKINLFRMDGSQITRRQVEKLTTGEKISFKIESTLPIYGYASKSKFFKNLFINPKKELEGSLLVSGPAPDANHITVCEFDRGLVNGFEIALTNHNGKTGLVVYPAWQATFSGNRQNLKITGVTFPELITGLKMFIKTNISRIPINPWNIKFRPYQKVPHSKRMYKDQIFIQRFKPHTGFGTAINKWGEKIMLDWKSIADIFNLEEGSIVQATIVKLGTPTKFEIIYTAIIGATTGSKLAYTDKMEPVKIGEINNNLSSLGEVFAKKLKIA